MTELAIFFLFLRLGLNENLTKEYFSKDIICFNAVTQ